MTLGIIKNLSDKHKRLIRRLIKKKKLKSYANGTGFDEYEFNEYLDKRAQAIKERSQLYRSDGLTALLSTCMTEMKSIDIAKSVGLSRERIRQLVKDKQILGRKDGKFVFINIRSLLKYLDKRVRDLEKEWQETVALRFP